MNTPMNTPLKTPMAAPMTRTDHKTEVRRRLEDVIDELVDGLSRLSGAGVRLTDVELGLPVETRVLAGPAGPVVHADMPALRTRTDFDLPLGRLVLRLSALPTEAGS